MTERRVVNTSPLIYLSRAGLLDLLKLDADEIAVPSAVAAEIHAGHFADAAKAALSTIPWLKLVADTPVPQPVLAWDLGEGESAVLAFALEHTPCEAVIDDLAARRCASSLGIPLRGTLGLVLRARKLGAIPSARQALTTLRSAGMYLSERVVAAALAEVGE